MSAELILAFVLFVGIALLIPVAIIMTKYLGPKVESDVKNEVYESGISEMIASDKQKFNVKFYLMAILFIIFDIEAVFMYPWGVNIRDLGHFGFIEMLVFVFLLSTGLIYIIRKGVLKW